MEEKNFLQIRDSDESKNDATVINTSEVSSVNYNSIVDTNDDSVDTTYSTSSLYKNGDIIDQRYRITTLIGKGGLCEVYRATDLLLETEGTQTADVAIKVLQSELSNNPDYNDLLLKEAKQTQALSHQNIVKVFNFGIDKHYYMVMELLDGETLEDIILRSRPNGLPANKTISLLEQIISAFKYAHAEGVVHSDLKPSNIMLTRKGVIKIFDFGVARAQNLNLDKYASINQNEISIVGGYTPAYASPSLFAGNIPTFQDDVYSFSCIAYELVTSKHPFNRIPSEKAVKQVLKRVRPNNIPKNLWQVLHKGLHFNPTERLKSFSQIENLLTKKTPRLAALVASVAIFSGIVGYGYYVIDQSRTDLLAQLSAFQQDTNYEKKLLSLPVEAMLKAISTIPDDKPVLKAALLRLNQEKIIDLYQDRIDQILNNSTNRYPDYYAIEDIINDALIFFPDSNSLYEINNRVSRSWKSSRLLIIDQINSILESGNYFDSKISSDIINLKSDLSQVDHSFEFIPSEKAISVFTDNFITSMRTLDSIKLNQLIEIGDVYFSSDEKCISLISNGGELVDAIQSITQYKKSQKTDTPSSFPYLAAELYYGHQFESFHTKLLKLKSVRQLQSLENDVNLLAQELPSDFSPLIQTRLAMAKRYLQFSDDFLSARQQRSASLVMKRANALFALIETSSSHQLDKQG